jgi:hypothetical protein
LAAVAVEGQLHTHSARRLILHAAGWPWAAWLALALARLRRVAYAT